MQAIVLTIVACVAMAAADSKPDFSGTWTLDAARSDPGEGGGFSIEIRHQDPEFLLTQIRGEERLTFRLTTDGKETVNPYPGGEMKSRMRWEGAELLAESSFGSITLKDRLSLSEDRRTITSLRHMTTENGERHLKYVFRKEDK
jgi:hypothetical protein